MEVSGVPPQADQGVCRRSNLIHFVLVLVLVLVNQNFIEDEKEYDNEDKIPSI
jgi:hypothetical protein